ncbi:MAG: SDR family NAD(P)-dependent oxidoreductase [Phycisphaera sp.]|nr:SDR family NAD(P)-dependent oxidoreductase [Phycisphaera sp.]
MSNPTTILITGAAGFIGSHLTDNLLASGQSVVGIDNFCDFYDPARKRKNIEKATNSKSFTLVEADIRDREAVMRTFEQHKPGCVVHLAAMAGVRPSIERPEYYTAVNLDGTVNLLDAAVKHSVSRFLFASSSSVYGNNEKVPFTETDNVDHPISPYAATKKAGELICHSYHHVHKLSIYCLRFFTVFGPRQRPDLAINKFMRLVAEGKPIPVFGDGSTSRDYTFVEDIVTGIRAAMDRCGKVGGYRVYNLGGSHPVTLSEMIATVERVTGIKAKLDRKPMQAGDVERTWADLTRSKTELGYEPHTTLEAGMAKQWAWMQST